MGFSLGQRAGDDMEPTLRLHTLARDIAIESHIGIEITTDDTLPIRGYWTIRIGDGDWIHGVNTPAAIAFLDGVRSGAKEARRIADIQLAQRIQNGER